ncbi:MAG: FAD:protein FMN transferase [Gammaproteobacteria bacterium]|jgi:thiamine biosynthesis lipoprotein|nr:FAD:protein FMN transferase [Gammaproteobacteria bacterium]MBT3843677.1 FAD:protein FMN transferase [Gammaproteobacteria bacterium]MBT5687185.1 FAD:protein FMN transferase [Gammaproteobacteria bacterium]MBT6478677.1 FAD:protein FMN transferase [Gammaproteobacteria bacterium]MBT6651803.1 FAD:protein FMN transferase [Gammaproteobacteria bacterium]
MQLHTTHFSALGSRNEIQLYLPESTSAKEYIEPVIREINRIEKKYSRYQPDSLLSKINQNAGIQPVALDEETEGLLHYAEQCHVASNGMFDITSGILRKVWRFDKESTLPSREEISRLVPRIGWKNVFREPGGVFLRKKGMEIDFGGIGKEYAADRAAQLLQELGINHGMVNLGGDIRAVGPQADGSPWKIGIQSPAQPSAIHTIFPLYVGAIATSGSYERVITIGSKQYCHLLNPMTGWPIEDAFSSVSVIADHCMVAGSITTIAMLLGRQSGEQWLRESGLQYLAE